MVAMAGQARPAPLALMGRPARRDATVLMVLQAETARTASMVHKARPVNAGRKASPVSQALWVMLARLDRKASPAAMRRHQRR